MADQQTQQRVSAAPPLPDTQPGVQSATLDCPNCGGQRFEWDNYYSTSIPPMGGTIARPTFILCCVDCSEIVQRADLDTVADLLNQIGWTVPAPAAPQELPTAPQSGGGQCASGSNT